MTAETPRLDTQLCYALYAATSTVTRIYRPLLQEIDLTYPQFLVMLALWQEERISISSLAERTSLTSSTMTPLLRRLEQKQLIARQASPKDERVKVIVLTPSGRELARHAEPITNAAFCATGLDRREVLTLMNLCHTLVQNHRDAESGSLVEEQLASEDPAD